MRVPSHPTQIRRMLDRRLKLLAPAGPVLAASLARVNKKCGQPSCACHHGGPLHQAHHLVFRQAGKTRTVFYYSAKSFLTEYHANRETKGIAAPVRLREGDGRLAARRGTHSHDSAF